MRSIRAGEPGRRTPDDNDQPGWSDWYSTLFELERSIQHHVVDHYHHYVSDWTDEERKHAKGNAG